MAIRRWGWMAIVVSGLVSANSWHAQESGPHWLAVDGHAWRRMGSDVRLAYVEGFLAGAAVGQAASGASDTSEVRVALEDLRQSGRLRFPFGSNVYASRVSDYYWWQNHLPLPTWYAFLEVNTTLGRRISDSMP
jgi:hypothetical protein